ncbi:hypothetical protein [Henriciella marina]|uniref:hypothetical protein n=1 Tax=Henriciella marina TaxID=453851 RepID=UPI000366BBC1|nr:hypothetical protein [Henriciella marina]
MALYIFHDPPVDRDFRELFQFICDHGIGQPMDAGGQFQPWSDESMEAAFADTATAVDKRSIQSWRSGASVPRLDKVRSLSAVITRSADQRRVWLKALIDARRKSLDARKQAASPTGSAEASQTPTDSDDPPRRTRRWVAVTAATMLIGLLVVGSGIVLRSYGAESQVANIEFCTEENFSTQTYTCLETSEAFDEDITTLMVTFDLINVPQGMSFERIWYREGLEFLRKSSFNDDAWPGYTFLNFDRFPEGNYTLRIIVDGKSFTSTFKVGDETGYLAYED